jgi:hypothetical protein
MIHLIDLDLEHIAWAQKIRRFRLGINAGWLRFRRDRLLRLNDTEYAARYCDRYAKRSFHLHSNSALSRGRDRQLRVPFRNFMTTMLFATAKASGKRKTRKK